MCSYHSCESRFSPRGHLLQSTLCVRPDRHKSQSGLTDFVAAPTRSRAVSECGSPAPAFANAAWHQAKQRQPGCPLHKSRPRAATIAWGPVSPPLAPHETQHTPAQAYNSTSHRQDNPRSRQPLCLYRHASKPTPPHSRQDHKPALHHPCLGHENFRPLSEAEPHHSTSSQLHATAPHPQDSAHTQPSSRGYSPPRDVRTILSLRLRRESAKSDVSLPKAIPHRLSRLLTKRCFEESSVYRILPPTTQPAKEGVFSPGLSLRCTR